MQINRHIKGLSCGSCGADYEYPPFRYQCSCRQNLDVVYDYPAIQQKWSVRALSARKEPSIWRYLPILPVAKAPDARAVTVGGTPLIDLPEMASEYSIGGLWLKDDTRQLSGSLKDRASEVGIRHAREMGADSIIAASTGNAAASLSALCAYHRMPAIILAPASAPPAKLTQILQYGARLIPVDSHYDDAFDLSFQMTEKFGYYSRNTGINPILSEGKKTAAIEIAEQLDWQVPDVVIVPVGDGCILGGIYKGFYDLAQLGFTDRIPRLIAVQAEGSSAIVDAWSAGTAIQPVVASTVADSISVNFPRDGEKALRAIRLSGGLGIKIPDPEILASQKELSARTGLFAEPAAAAAWAGFRYLVNSGRLNQSDRVVVLITGSGLKDISSAQKMISIPEPVKADMASIESFVRSQWGLPE